MVQHKNKDNALEILRTYGWKVFPALAFRDGNHIIPKGMKWRTMSSNEPGQVEEWARQYPGCYFCVDLGSSGVCVVDVDTKHGQNGFDTLAKYSAAMMELSPTLISDTPTGGRHAFYAGDMANTVKTGLGDGLDTKGSGGMVPLPGQDVPGKGAYTPTGLGCSIAPLPNWVSRLVQQANTTKHENRDDAVIEELDQQKDINRAVAYLSVTAPIGGPGQHNDTLYKVSCQLRDYGISIETAVILVTQFWNPRILTPRTAEEIESTVSHAYDYARDRAGTAAVGLGVMGPVPGYQESQNPHIPVTLDDFEKDHLHTLECLPDDAMIPKREWLIENTVAKGFCTVLVAPGGAGKTTWAMEMAMAAARGDGEFMGLRVSDPNGMKVWLYNGEDPFDELQRRAAGIIKGFNLDDLKRKGDKAGNFIYSSGVENGLCLMEMNEETRRTVITEQADLMKAFIKKHDIKMVVLDPFVSIHSLDEQSNKAMDDLMKRVFGRIAAECGCSFIIVHHTRKGASDKSIDASRGAGAVAAAARAAFLLEVMGKEEASKLGVPDEKRRWFVRLVDAKQNMSPPAEKSTWYERKSVMLANGDAVGTLALADLTSYKEEKKKGGISDEFEVGAMERVLDYLEPEQRLTVSMVAREVIKREPLFFKGVSEEKLKKLLPILFFDPIIKGGLSAHYVLDPDMTSTDPRAVNAKSDQWIVTRATYEEDDKRFAQGESEDGQGSVQATQ